MSQANWIIFDCLQAQNMRFSSWTVIFSDMEQQWRQNLEQEMEYSLSWGILENWKKLNEENHLDIAYWQDSHKSR